MGFSTATAWEGFSEGCADDAEGSWGCQVEAAEQRVGFFNQELRPISNDQLNQSLRQPSELSVRSATDAVRVSIAVSGTEGIQRGCRQTITNLDSRLAIGRPSPHASQISSTTITYRIRHTNTFHFRFFKRSQQGDFGLHHIHTKTIQDLARILSKPLFTAIHLHQQRGMHGAHLPED